MDGRTKGLPGPKVGRPGGPGRQAQNREPRTPYSFRNLSLWQKAQDLALAVINVAATLPRDDAAQIIGRQLITSAGSIGANVAEGHGGFSLAAHRNYLSIAKSCACESDSWLDLLRRAGYIDVHTERDLHRDCVQIMRMLTTKIRDLEQRERSGRPSAVREDGAVYEVHDYDSGSEP